MQVNKYEVPENLYYDTNDFWIKVNGTEATVGMTDYGQSNTGDILYLELLSCGESFNKGDRFGSIESGKWVGNLNAPITGTIIEVNQKILDNPRLVNSDCYEKGWMYRISITDVQDIDKLLKYSNYAQWMIEQIRCENEDLAI